MTYAYFDMSDKTTRRGRPRATISWPDGEFTAQEVFEKLAGQVSRVTVHNRLNSAVDSGQLRIVGKRKSSNGRPRVVYASEQQQQQQELSHSPPVREQEQNPF